MGKFLKIASLLIFFGLITSCAVSKPLVNDYYKSNKKVGVDYQIGVVRSYLDGVYGRYDMQPTIDERFEEPLKVAEKRLNITSEMKKFYGQLFERKGKYLEDVSNKVEYESFNNFEKPNSSDKKYFNFDLRPYKDAGIDELLIVKVRYGVVINYQGANEKRQDGYCQIESEIIDLSDNSIIYKGLSEEKVRIKGKSKKIPKYENLELAISKAIQKAIDLEKEKLDK